MLTGLLLGALVMYLGYDYQTEHDICVSKENDVVKIDDHKLCEIHKKVYDLKDKLSEK